MKNEKKFKKFLQERFDGEEFPLTDSAWRNTRDYVNARRRRDRRRGVVVTTALIVVAVIAFVFTKPEPETLRVVSSKAPFLSANFNAGISDRDRTRPGKETNAGIKRAAASKGKNFSMKQAIWREHPVNGKVPGIAHPVSAIKSASRNTDKDEILRSAIHLSLQRQITTDTVRKTGKALSLGHAEETGPAVSVADSLVEFKPMSEEAIPADLAARLAEQNAPTPPEILGESFAKADAPDSGIVSDSGSSVPARKGLFYEIGGAFLNGWKYGALRDGRGFTPVAGIGYIDQLDNWRSVSFGVRYMMVSGLSAGYRTSRITGYRFGEESSVTVITPTTLHYLVLPFRYLQYDGRSNVFGGGVNVGYLLNVDASVSRYNERPGYRSDAEESKLSGYTEGFSWYDTQVCGFYRRDLGCSLALQAELFVGLIDIKSDEFFRQQSNERNSGIKVTLIYYTRK